MFFNNDVYPGDNWYPGRMMDGYRGDNMMDGGGWIMVIFMLILLVLAVSATLWVIRGVGSNSVGANRSVSPGSARDVLDLRLARGEIKPEEYSAARALLDP